jgi:hypothetical protein
MNDYYDKDTRPKGFTSSAYLKEIRLSYRLLFSDNSRSRRRYQRVERKFALAEGQRDLFLDQLCALSTGIEPEDSLADENHPAPTRASYNTTSDFPILGERLLIIQDYMDRQQPSTVVALWKDRRDLLRFYTFWAVTIVDGLSLLFSLVQIFLSAEQVQLAKDAMNHS